MKEILKRSLVIGSALLLVVGIFWQVEKTNADDLTPDQRAALQAQLTQIEQQIAAQQTILDQTVQQGKSISTDIAGLNAQIKQAQLKIQAHNLAIAQLGKDITVRTQNITTLDGKISDGQQSLAQILRQTKMLDDVSLPEVLLSGQDLSSFLSDLDSFDAVKSSMADTFDNLKGAEAENQKEKQTLSQQQSLEIDAKISIQDQEAVIAKAQADKKTLLSQNKSQQATQQAAIAANQAAAAKIQAALFSLANTSAIPFGQALTYALAVQKVTGVDPAFLLSIITQESNLGSNVGSCYLSDPTTGAGVKVTSGTTVANVMKPTRDVQPFLQITAAVGRDPYKTRVSCPLSIGYGGAMGPAQFIPSTWVLFAPRIQSGLGVANADPWNPEHAFMASALYLSDLGASSGAYTDEKNAACKYYSGRACGIVSGASSYGASVMTRTASIQANINIINSAN